MEAGLDLVGVGGVVVAYVDEGAGVVLAVGGDEADAGQAQQQGGGQRGRVEGGEDQRGVGVDRVDELPDLAAADGRGFEAHPGRVPHEDVVDAGQQPGGGGRRVARTAG
ncbi:hypothetical protein [Streptomyces sp. NPDC058735]|uniref:hypothetical protein n=1 Tax=unclassified Streptomyces TaxID=2593676 RepID=UPI0036754E44